MDNNGKYIDWSNLSEAEKDEISRRNKTTVEETEKHLNELYKRRGFITYGDFYKACGIWTDKDIRRHPFLSNRMYI